MTKVKNGDKVKVHYTGTLEDGSVFDSSANREPLEFEVGGGQMIPGFDKGVVGMELNETKNISIASVDAYGEQRQELIQEVSKELLPKEMEVTVGQTLVSQTPEGQQFHVIVKEIKEDTIVIDGNHPLAGKDLKFEIKMVEITPA